MPQAARIVSKTIPPLTLQKLRKFIREQKWKSASSPAYANAPHSYIIAFWYPGPDSRFDNKTPWKWFADLIREHGTYRSWRGHRYRYLLLDGYAFWTDFPALNKARQDTLD